MPAMLTYSGANYSFFAGPNIYCPVFGYGSLPQTEVESTTYARTVREAATISVPYLFVSLNTTDAGTTVRGRKDTGSGFANANISFTVPTATTGIFKDASSTDSVAIGDRYHLHGTGPSTGTISSQFTAIVTGTGIQIGGTFASLRTNTTAEYANLLGGVSNISATRTNAEMRVLAPGAIHHFGVAVNNNARTGAADVLTVYKNGSSTSLTVSVTAGATGLFEDASNSMLVGLDDVICVEDAPGASGGFFAWYPTAWLTVPTNYHGVYWGAAFSNPTLQVHLGGGSQQLTLSGNDTPAALQIDLLWVYMSAFSGATVSVTLAKNGTATALTVSPSGTGWTGDVSNVVTSVVDDELETQYSRSVGTATIQNIQYRVSQNPTGFVQNDLYDLPFYVYTGGHVQLNLSGAYTIPTVRNAVGCATTVSTSVPLKVTVLDRFGVPIETAQVAVLVAGVLWVNGDTNASGVITGSFTDATPVDALVRVRKASTGATKYVATTVLGTIESTAGLDVTVVLEQDAVAG
jgi:hypothetical protein